MILQNNKNTNGKQVFYGSAQSNRVPFSEDQIQSFKVFVSQELSGSKRKLSGNQMTQLKKTHFNQYIRKLKYYAKRDASLVEQDQNLFTKAHLTNYQQKQSILSRISKPKPENSLVTHQPSVYYNGKPQITSMRQFIFLTEENKKIDKKLNMINQKSQNKQFVKSVQRRVQSCAGQRKAHTFNQTQTSKTNVVNLYLTAKSAKKINESQTLKQTKIDNGSQIHESRSFRLRKSASLGGQSNFNYGKVSSSLSTMILTGRKVNGIDIYNLQKVYSCSNT